MEAVVLAPLSVYSVDNVLTNRERGAQQTKTLQENVKVEEIRTELGGDSRREANCDIPVIDLTQCDDEIVEVKPDNLESSASSNVEPYVAKSVKNDKNQRIRKSRKSRSKHESSQKSVEPRKSVCQSELLFAEDDMSLVQRPEAEGSSLSDQETENTDLDPELEELSKLRCTSERTEVLAEKEMRRRGRRCADYPGLAFSSIFSSDTLMKFSIIRNEIQNIMNTQLKRVRIF